MPTVYLLLDAGTVDVDREVHETIIMGIFSDADRAKAAAAVEAAKLADDGVTPELTWKAEDDGKPGEYAFVDIATYRVWPYVLDEWEGRR